jgi:hypothetical protein
VGWQEVGWWHLGARRQCTTANEGKSRARIQVWRGPGIALASFISDEGQPARAINGRWNATTMHQVKAPITRKEKRGDAD